MEKEKLNQEPQQPSQEEMVKLLSQTVLQQDAQIKNLTEELNLARKEITYLKDELSKPQAMEAPESIERRAVERYLEHELDYATTKISELRHHLVEYPEDDYARQDLHNSLLHLNYLKAMMRRVKFYN